ncbi:uncharacterized protein N7483_001991 [Penicillium malachiteum]|uniref:uncharacterized protein n=1 Tax=Penicillium malachiteum TaxID=1324776 RepID=UPI002546A788|nr:uncharacterized protein N7483_001991 [Penicillium malachiteum]KAJ5736866.1 hypothetical protein N7483_001991 [Penicillium malachiteum]
MALMEEQIRGLAWVQKTFSLEPRWTVEPNPEAIKRTVQLLKPSSTVNFLAQGAFNKVYDVVIDNEVFIMRISLPVDPYCKTMKNPVGFEWIFMTKIPGKPLKEIWRSPSFDRKEYLVGELASYAHCLFQNKFWGIGNIYGVKSTLDSKLAEKIWPVGNPVYPKSLSLSEKEKIPDDLLDVGRIVSMDFFGGSRILQDVDRGRFGSSRDWIISRLSPSEKDNQLILDNLPSGDLDSDDEADADDATRTLDIIEKLKGLLPSVFPPGRDDPEVSILFHDDLSSRNILVQDSGELTAVLDWECVSVLPLRSACYYPALLKGRPKGRPQRLEPDIGRYKLETETEPSDLYWEHLLEYELTLLREVFIDRMRILAPEWEDIFHKSQRQRDFDTAVHNCDNEFIARYILAWIDDITAEVENPRSLRDRIDEY